MTIPQTGDTAFAIAVKQGHRDAAKQILSMGATKPPGPLHYVVQSTKDLNMATWLIEIGYDVESLDEVRDNNPL